MAAQQTPPRLQSQTLEALALDVEAKLIRQEHRLIYIVRNALEFRRAPEGDPRRDAAHAALAFRVVLALVPGATVVTTGVVAFVGLVLAFQANSLLNEQNDLIRAQQEEAFTVSLNSLVNGRVRVTDHKYPGGTVVQFPWLMTVSNVGQQRLSLTGYRVSEIDKESGEIKREYTGIDGGLFDERGEVVRLPISLDAGEALKLTLMVGMIVPADVFSKYPPGTNGQLLDRDVSVHLGRQGIDTFGNPVELSEYGGGITISYHGEEKAPGFGVTVRSARGRTAAASAQKFVPDLKSYLEAQPSPARTSRPTSQ